MILLPLHAAATLVMFGVILIVQRVHYPLFHYVRAAGPRRSTPSSTMQIQFCRDAPLSPEYVKRVDIFH